MSGWGDRQAEEGEENDEDGLEDEFRSTEDHVLFLIDARSAMFARTEAGEAYIVNCLRVVQNVMKTKIVASERSRVGVILFGAVSAVHTLLTIRSSVTDHYIHDDLNYRRGSLPLVWIQQPVTTRR